MADVCKSRAVGQGHEVEFKLQTSLDRLRSQLQSPSVITCGVHVMLNIDLHTLCL